MILSGTKKVFLTTSLLLPSLFFLYSCTEVKSNSKNNFPVKEYAGDKKQETQKTPAGVSGTGCDSALWKYVYDPSRLEIIDPCKEVTGIIEEMDANEDGDEHMLLKLDPGQKSLLNKKNETKKKGDLVIEVVCANNITVKKAKETCKGYLNHVQLPKMGAHVKVTGSYVIDTHNDWAEIHPVTKIEEIKN